MLAQNGNTIIEGDGANVKPVYDNCAFGRYFAYGIYQVTHNFVVFLVFDRWRLVY